MRQHFVCCCSDCTDFGQTPTRSRERNDTACGEPGLTAGAAPWAHYTSHGHLDVRLVFSSVATVVCTYERYQAVCLCPRNLEIFWVSALPTNLWPAGSTMYSLAWHKHGRERTVETERPAGPHAPHASVAACSVLLTADCRSGVAAWLASDQSHRLLHATHVQLTLFRIL
jgi:hypothetical protein